MHANSDPASSSDEDFVSATSSATSSAGNDVQPAMDLEAPAHPVRSMQAAFEESILESVEEDEDERPPSADGSAEMRRQKILNAGVYNDAWTARWNQNSAAQHHPLVKLLAQIVFGMHLLQQQAAKSDEEVVKILQTHVDEVDNFLEKTMDDFDLAIKDIDERIKFLKLPMNHKEVFEQMLEDRKFRTQLLEGNDKIERIVERTTRAMNAALLDVHQGRGAVKELGKYLDKIEHSWPNEKPDLAAIFGAMRGNEGGWKQCLRDLQRKGAELGEQLAQLATVISDMSRIAAAVSRRQRPYGRGGSMSATSMLSSVPRSKFSGGGDSVSMRNLSVVSLDKPLPQMPESKAGALRRPSTRQHSVPFAERYESPRESPAEPTRGANRSSTVPPRPKTAGSAPTRTARNVSKGDTADLAEYLKQTGPKPAPTMGYSHGDTTERGSIRSASATVVRRSRGQSAVEKQDTSRPTINGSKKPSRSSTWGERTMGAARRSMSRGTETHSRAQSRDLAPSNNPSRRESLAGTRFVRRLSVRAKHLEPLRHATATPSTPSESPSPDKKFSPTDSKIRSSPSNSSTPRLALFPSSDPNSAGLSALPVRGGDVKGMTPSIVGTEGWKGRGFSLKRMFGRGGGGEGERRGRSEMSYGDLV